MNKYKEYMDGVAASNTLHEKLENLAPPPRRTQHWKKYGVVAAALVLVAGLGVWGISGLGGRTELGETPAIGENVMEPAIEPAPGPMPDSQGQPTMGGYELRQGEGDHSVVEYFYLPYIQYGEVENEMAADIALPVGVTRRDLTAEEIEALFGGETNLVSHLNWGGYEIGAYAMVWPDDSMWLLCVYGSKGNTGLEHFSLEVSPGQLPPSCLYYAKSELNNIWEHDVWAESYDSVYGSSRRVSFMDGDYGYRFEIAGLKAGDINELVSRAVRWIIVGDGLLLDQNLDVPADVPVDSEPSATPGYSVGEPNYEDAPRTEPAEPVEEVSTPAYDPSASKAPE